MEVSPQQLNRLLSDDELNVHSEERVFEAVLAWIKYEPDVRQVGDIISLWNTFKTISRLFLQIMMTTG